MEFTTSQQIALNQFKTFLGGKEQVFILQGAAGTGKTTILKEMIGVLNKRHPGSDLAILMAPTGRAAYILKSKTGHNACTIHRQIYDLTNLSLSRLHPEDEYTEVKLHFTTKLAPHNDEWVLFVDEASLISNTFNENEAFGFGSGYLLNDLMEYARNTKIVFIGDPAQLPPIGMVSSPALDKSYLKEHYGVECVCVELNEIKRQDVESGILSNAENIRQSIKEGTFAKFKIHEATDVRLSQNVVEDFASIQGPLSNRVIITFRNVDARNYNLAIRKRLIGENVARIVEGDLLVVSRNNYLKEELFNGTIVKVLRTDSDDELIKKTIMVPLKERQNDKAVKIPIELRFRHIEVEFMRDGKVTKEIHLMLDNFLDSNEPQLDRNTAVALFLDFKFRHPNLKPGKEEFLEALRTDIFYNALLCKYGYALTCHKAQGGEWKNVIVDMDRPGGKTNENYFRWAYTALTRCSENLWHFNSPRFDELSKLKIATITKGGNFTYPVDNSQDFKELKFEAVKNASAKVGITCHQDLSANWQHRIIFEDESGNHVRFSLWYNAKGYSNSQAKADQVSTPEFEQICRALLDTNPGIDFDYKIPDRKEARILHEHITEICRELGIKIIHVVNDNWRDTYYLLTSGHAVVNFIYNGKGQYTYLDPQSDKGEDDDLLQKFCENF